MHDDSMDRKTRLPETKASNNQNLNQHNRESSGNRRREY